jgi:hypothetical protein
MKPCSANRADGTPCKARALPGRDVCFAHDDSLKGVRAIGRKRGGLNRRSVVRLDRLTPASLRPVLGRLYGALDALEDGTLDPRRAAAMAAVATCITRIFEGPVIRTHPLVWWVATRTLYVGAGSMRRQGGLGWPTSPSAWQTSMLNFRLRR